MSSVPIDRHPFKTEWLPRSYSSNPRGKMAYLTGRGAGPEQVAMGLSLVRLTVRLSR
jgi:hypothetical protein